MFGYYDLKMTIHKSEDNHILYMLKISMISRGHNSFTRTNNGNSVVCAAFNLRQTVRTFYLFAVKGIVALTFSDLEWIDTKSKEGPL